MKCQQRFEVPSVFLLLSLILRINTYVGEHVYVRGDEKGKRVACCAL